MFQKTKSDSLHTKITKKFKLGVVMQVYSPNTQEAEAGRLLQIQDHVV